MARKNKKLPLWAIIVILVISGIWEGIHLVEKENAPKEQPQYTTHPNGKFTVMFYNVENLFDPADAPTQNDDEFTPAGEKHWTYDRYKTKLKHLANVIALVGDDELPDIIGVAEVEDRKVLEDLINTPPLNQANYKIIHEESLDPRGIDVALIYKPSEFQYISHKQIYIYNKNKKMRTRPILMVEGIYNGEKVYIFVNHWKSRVPSAEETEYKRILAAATLRNVVRKILQKDPKANIIILGDFNDTCYDESIKKKLKASLDKKFKNKLELYNAMADECKKDKGTVYHGKHWFMFDQIIVSQALIDKKGLDLEGSAKVFTGDHVLDDKGRPNRTYHGKEFNPQGVSDHLPVYAVFKY